MLNEIKKTNDDFIKIEDLFQILKSKWYWFAACVLASMALVMLYLKFTPPVYTRTATILIKEMSKSGYTAGYTADFDDLGIFKSNTNVNNELITLKSPSLMKEVVAMLDLDKSYIVERGMRKVNLCKMSPVWVSFVDPDAYSLEFDITILSHNRVQLSNIVYAGNSLPGEIEANLTDTITAPFGEIMVIPSAYFNNGEGIESKVRFVKSDFQNVANRFSNTLQAMLANKDATVVKLSINDKSPRRAEDILNALIAVYNEDWMNNKNRISISTSQFINERLNVIEDELGDVDKNISSYKSEHILPDVEAVSGMYLSQYAESGKVLLGLNNRLSIAEQIRLNLNDASGDRLLPVNSGLENVNLENQIGEYNSLLMRRNNLLSNSSEKNPLVINMNQSLADIKQAMSRSVDIFIESMQTQIDNVKRQETRVTGQIASNPNQASYLHSVERQQKVKEALYLYLLQKREENELSQAFTAYNTRVITPPNGSNSPTEPRRHFLYLAGMMAGMLFPMTIFVVKERTNTTVRGRKDLEGMTIPYVGEIPLHPNEKNNSYLNTGEKLDIVVKVNSRNAINEAFRIIRTNLEFMLKKEKRANVIMLTSFNPKSGKTFVAMNLAAAFGINGKKVLICDLDMRTAQLSNFFGSPAPGIANYLGWQVDHWQPLVFKNDTPGCPDLLPVGNIPPNPAELLYDARLEQMISELARIYDYIIIDCPPMGVVADPTLINKWVDMTLFVARAGLLDRQKLPEIENYYTSRKFKNMALILNGTEWEHTYYRYDYGLIDKKW